MYKRTPPNALDLIEPPMSSASSTSTLENDPEEQTLKKWPTSVQPLISELKIQRKIALPLAAMNLTWFAKFTITTDFLGELQLAGATLGFTFANVTGFSILNGLSGAMEPICGQAYGAQNFKLLHKTLVMTTLFLLAMTLPISFLWLNVDRILIHLGQQQEISIVAKKYLLFLIPDLVITSVLCPLKTYLSSQNILLPNMLASALAVALHIPINLFFSKAKGLEGVSMAVWVTDTIVAIPLVFYVLIAEKKKGGRWNEGGWLDQRLVDWVRFLKLSGSCCLTTCLEWWCVDVLVLLTGRVTDANRDLEVLAIVLNFDYLLYSIMLSLSTCVSIRVSNELGANQPRKAHRSAYVCLALSLASGFIGGALMVAARGFWGSLFSTDKEVIRGVKKAAVLMAAAEVASFPLTVCGGIVRGTARPWLAMYANIGGFYLLALPLGVVLAFRVHLGLNGLQVGFLVGVVFCLVLVLVFVTSIDWDGEACKAQVLAGSNLEECVQEEEGNSSTEPRVSEQNS